MSGIASTIDKFIGRMVCLASVVLLAMALACGGGGSSEGAPQTPPVTTTKPAAPAGLTAVAGDGQVSLTWTASANATGYFVLRGSAAGGPYTKVFTTAIPGTTYTNTGLTNNTPYYYVVTASNSAGESGHSNEASATPVAATVSISISPDSTVLQPGGTFTFTATVTGTTNTAVTWSVEETDGGNINGSGLYTAPAAEGTYHVIATSVADATKTATAVVYVSSTMIIPPDRLTVWNPGLNSVSGGIPTYTSIFGAALSPSGGSDTQAIQDALDAAGAVATKASPKVVKLNAGTYMITGQGLSVPSYVVLRGAGPDSTKLIRDFKGTGKDVKVKIVTGGLGGDEDGGNVATFVYSTDGGTTYTTPPVLIENYVAWDLDNPPVPGMRITFQAGKGTTYTAGDIFTIHWDDTIGPFGDWSISHAATSVMGLQLDHYGEGGSVVYIGSSGWADLGTFIDLTSDAVKDATSVTVSSTSGLAAGDLVHLDQLNDSMVWYTDTTTSFSRDGRNETQRLEIDHIAGNTIYFTTPFHWTFSVAQSAQLAKVNSPVRYAGVEDLYAYGANSGDGGGNFYIANGMYCWIKHVESERSAGSGAGLSGSFRSVIRDSYIHTAAKIMPASAEYLIGVETGSADNLIENNIVWDGGKATVMRSSGGGNVFGYNYMDDIFISYDPTFIESGLNASHQSTPHFELFEGNQSFNFDSDTTHGNAFNIVVFRNHLTGLRRSAMRPLPSFGAVSTVDNHDGHGPVAISLEDEFPRACVRPTAHDYNFSFIGNVLGFSGMPIAIAGTQTRQTSAVYDMEGNDVDPSVLGMWMLGSWLGIDGASAQDPPDPNVIDSVLRDANFDYVTNQQRWHGIGRGTPPYSAPANYVLPSSLYLTAKPAFFGSNPWPWVTPEGTTKTFTLPARARFDAGTPNTVQ